METKELTLVNEDQTAGFIQLAIEKGLNVETMEKLFALHEKVKAERAREAFVTAMADFQGEVPVIKKNKTVLNKDGRTIRYKYAPMESVIEQIKKPLAKNHLAYSWDVVQKDNHMTVTVKVTHSLGHFETSTLSIPIELSQYMNSPQSYATAQSYAKRYTLLNALGIATADEDTDANGLAGQKDAKNVKARIVALLKNLGYKTDTREQIEEAVKKIAKLDLTDKNYNEIVGRLEITLSEINNGDADTKI